MFNDNVVDFTLYAGYLLGRSITFLEKVGDIMLTRTDVRLIGSSAFSTHPGYQIIRRWLTASRDAVNSASTNAQGFAKSQ